MQSLAVSYRLFIYISCSYHCHQDKNQHFMVMASQLTLFGESTVNKSTRRTYTRESEIQCSGSSKISTFHPAASSLANYNGTISAISATQLFCHVYVLPKRCHGFGVWSIFAFIIKRILGNKRTFPCSFGNKRMRLLTCVYGTLPGG